MKIVGFEKLSLVDYVSKIACTVFLGGCNMACPFCHNSSLVFDYKSLPEINKNDILSYLRKREGIIEAICISGGEPTINNDLETFIDEIKETKILVKLDTNGTNYKMLTKLLPKLDYVAMDVKNSIKAYPMTSGLPNNANGILDNIQNSIALLKQNKVDYEFRVTLVKEFHNDNSIKELGELVKGAKRLYLQKFIDRGSCITQGLHSVSIEDATRFMEILKEYVSVVELRNYD